MHSQGWHGVHLLHNKVYKHRKLQKCRGYLSSGTTVMLVRVQLGPPFKVCHRYHTVTTHALYSYGLQDITYKHLSDPVAL
jgi:hypothetical protein